MPELLMATITDRYGEESEPVTVEIEDKIIHLTMDGFDIALLADDLRRLLRAA